MKKVDIHPHVISDDEARYPLAPLGGNRSTWSQERPLTGERLLAAMDEAGIDLAAVVQSSTTYGHDNSYVCDVAMQHPDRLTAVFSIDVLAPDAVERMKHWQARGGVGMRLFTTGSTMPGQSTWLDDPVTFPAWEYASDAGLPICLQVLPAGLGMVETLLRRFPRVTVVLDHLGMPDVSDGPPYDRCAKLFELAAFSNLNLKLTPFNVSHATDGKASAATFFGRIFESYGSGRIAWGSNYPASPGTLPEMIAATEAALDFLSDEQRADVFGGTALRIYPAMQAL
jgi:L-fuconolactonase